METITIIEKPDSISFDSIHDLLQAAHEVNRDKGFSISSAKLSGEELETKITENGKCFVAMYGDEIAGTCSVRFYDSDKWYSKGKTAEYMLIGILPTYQGKHISSFMTRAAVNAAETAGCKTVVLRTAEKNAHAIGVYKHSGFYLADYRVGNTQSYTVIMARPEKDSVYFRIKCAMYYTLKRFYIRIRFKAGGKKRFGI